MNREALMKLEKEEIISVLLAIIQQQAEKIAELEARLNQNSKNSSKPPSSDGLNKPKSLRKPSGKKAGGQQGHEGSGLKLMREPDNYVLHEPEECACCPMVAKCCVNKTVCETRYEIDIVINTVTTAHQVMQMECPRSAKTLTGRFPESISSTMQYGINLETLAISLNTVGMVSISRTHEILSGVFGVPISTGTIATMVSGCAEKVADTVKEIKESIIEEPLIQVDETGVRVDGRTIWAHTAATENLTYIEVQQSRGKVAMDKIGILLAFFGTVIHDCLAAHGNQFSISPRLTNFMINLRHGKDDKNNRIFCRC